VFPKLLRTTSAQLFDGPERTPVQNLEAPTPMPVGGQQLSYFSCGFVQRPGAPKLEIHTEWQGALATGFWLRPASPRISESSVRPSLLGKLKIHATLTV
jgi:hypothetical protein